MTVMAMHQPNYIPWLGYFHKMASCDVFVYLDAVQFPRGRNFSARNKIKTPDGATWLTIPVSKPPGREGKASYLDLGFADAKWREKHLKTLAMAYRRAPYFDEVFHLCRTHMERAADFVELTVGLNDAIADYLGILDGVRTVRLSHLLSAFGQKSDLIVDISRAVGADTYLSGKGGGYEYNDEAVLNAAGIALRYDEFEHPVYDQLWGDFVSHLSILDLLFNHGRASRALLLGAGGFGDTSGPAAGRDGSI